MLIKNCLKSIILYNNVLPVEIIIVDNNSKDGGKESILQEYPLVRWIQMDYNTGFARANNAGIKAADADVRVLVNSARIARCNSFEYYYQ